MISRKYPSTRLRRLRQSESIIDLISECAVTKNDLIQPVFVKEGLSDKFIEYMGNWSGFVGE